MSQTVEPNSKSMDVYGTKVDIVIQASHEGKDALSLDEDIAASDLLQQWLPKLNQYQEALNDKEQPAIGLEQPAIGLEQPAIGLEQPKAEDLDSTTIPIEPDSIDFPDLQVKVERQLLHLPIDGILASIQKRSNYLLGLGSCGPLDVPSRSMIASELAVRLSEKLQRKTLLVRLLNDTERTETADDSSHSAANLSVDVSTWQYFEDSKAGKSTWNAQLATLVFQKRDFSLVVFDLGDASSESMHRMGRLCDGVIIQLQPTAGSRKAIQTIKRLKEDRIQLLGVWS